MIHDFIRFMETIFSTIVHFFNPHDSRFHQIYGKHFFNHCPFFQPPWFTISSDLWKPFFQPLSIFSTPMIHDFIRFMETIFSTIVHFFNPHDSRFHQIYGKHFFNHCPFFQPPWFTISSDLWKAFFQPLSIFSTPMIHDFIRFMETIFSTIVHCKPPWFTISSDLWKPFFQPLSIFSTPMIHDFIRFMETIFSTIVHCKPPWFTISSDLWKPFFQPLSIVNPHDSRFHQIYGNHFFNHCPL